MLWLLHQLSGHWVIIHSHHQFCQCWICSITWPRDLSAEKISSFILVLFRFHLLFLKCHWNCYYIQIERLQIRQEVYLNKLKNMKWKFYLSVMWCKVVPCGIFKLPVERTVIKPNYKVFFKLFCGNVISNINVKWLWLLIIMKVGVQLSRKNILITLKN